MTSAATALAPTLVGNDARLGEFLAGDTVRFVRDFRHPPREVWAVLTDKAEIPNWLWPCSLFEARLGGRYSFGDMGLEWGGEILEFDPPRRLNLGGLWLFELCETVDGCQLVLLVKRPPGGWSPMTLAGFHGWMGRLTRRFDGTAQAETEAWAADIWDSVFPAYERAIRRGAAAGQRFLYRLHFSEGDAALTDETRAHLTVLAALMAERADLDVVADGFGEDAGSEAETLALCAERIAAAFATLEAMGVAKTRLHRGFVLGNYHPLVPNDSEAGRTFNRRIELRVTF
jgi:outer membrane protein OmpA-like peptidoglycan-associated protein